MQLGRGRDCVAVCCQVMHEVRQVLHDGVREYLTDAWNWIDFVMLIMLCTQSVMDYTLTYGYTNITHPGGFGEHSEAVQQIVYDIQAVVEASCGFLVWFNLLYFLRAGSRTGNNRLPA